MQEGRELIQDYLRKGAKLYDEKKYNEAIACYDEITKLAPKHADAYFKKGESLYELNKKEEAIKYYDKAIEIEPNEAIYYTRKGNAFFDLNKKGEAIKCYDKAIEINPKCAPAYHSKSLYFHDLGQTQQAIKWCEKAIESDPTYGPSYNVKGNFLYNNGRREESMKWYKKAIELNPNCFKAYYNLANVFADFNNHEEALKYYDKSIALNQKFASIFNNKGNTLIKLKKYEEAIDSFNKAIELRQGKSPLNFCKRAEAFEATGKATLALEDLRTASKLLDQGYTDGMNIENINFVKDALRNLKRLEGLVKTIEVKALSVSATASEKAKTNNAMEEFKSTFGNVLATITTQQISKTEKSGEAKNKPQDPEYDAKETGYKKRIEQLENIVKKVESAEKSGYAAILIDMIKEMNEMKEQLAGVKTRITAVEDKVKELATELGMTKKEFEEKFKVTEQEITKIKDSIKEGFTIIQEKFGTEKDLKDYAIQFYYVLNDYIQAYKILNTGEVEAQSDSLAQKIAGFFSSLPVIGHVAGIVESVIEYYGSVKRELKYAAVANIVKLSETALGKNISKIVAETVVCITDTKRKCICDSLSENPSLIGKAKDFICGKIDDLKSYLTKVNISPPNKAEELAIEDVGLFINSLIRYKDHEIIKYGVLNYDIFVKVPVDTKENISNVKVSTEGSCACVMFPIITIKYENPLLNRGCMLSRFAKNLQVSAGEIMDRSVQLMEIFGRDIFEGMCENEVQLVEELMENLTREGDKAQLD